MEQILEYIKQNGLPVFIIATRIIAIVGTLKLCKVFDKISSKNVKKFIYYILDIALSFGSSAIYFAIFKLNFNDYLIFSVSQISSTTALYALYENFGLRKLVQMLIEWLSKRIKIEDAIKLAKIAEKIGLDKALDQIKEQIIENEKKLAEEQNKEEIQMPNTETEQA